MWLLRLLTMLLKCCSASRAGYVVGSDVPNIELNNGTGAYAVVTERWRLPGGPVRIFCSGRWYCSDYSAAAPKIGAGGVCYAPLHIACVNPATIGADALGEFNDRSVVWMSSDGVVQSLITQWRTYLLLGAVVFNTRMKTTCDNCSLPDQQPITHFPALDVDATTSRASGRLIAPELGWLTFSGWQQQQQQQQQQQLIQSSGTGLGSLCRWNATAGTRCGLSAGIPLVIFERSANASTLLIAPLNTIGDLSVSRTASLPKQQGGPLVWGLQGSLKSLDDGSAVYHDLTSAVLLLTGRGVRRTLAAWGTLMRRWYRRELTTPETSLSLSHLGYATDPGSAYYYNTMYGTGTGARYNDTFRMLREEAAAKGVRYRTWQLDSCVPDK